jgi:archaellum biogenesis ATPase FlaH
MPKLLPIEHLNGDGQRNGAATGTPPRENSPSAGHPPERNSNPHPTADDATHDIEPDEASVDDGPPQTENVGHGFYMGDGTWVPPLELTAPPEQATYVESSTMADAENVISAVRYLVPGWVPFGMVTCIIAEPGAGKSALALSLARAIVLGLDWFANAPTGDPAKVLWLGTENDMAITVDRIKKWGVPSDHILLPFADPLATVNLTASPDLDRVAAVIDRHRPAAVFVDSLRGGHVEDENNSRVGRVVQTLGRLAERTGVALVVVHHSKKLSVDEEITANSSRGSNAILAMMRSQLGIDQPDKMSGWKRLRMLKENLGLRPSPIGFQVTETGVLFGSAPQRPQTERSRTPALDEAEEWLVELLKDGPVLATEAEQQLKADLMSEKTVRKAKKNLGIVSKKVGSGPWMWQRAGEGGNPTA